MNLQQKAQAIADSVTKLLHIQCELREEPGEDPANPKAIMIEPQKTLSYGAIMGAIFLKYGADMRPVRQKVKYGDKFVFRNVLKRLGAKIYCVCDQYAFVTDIIVEDARAADLKPSALQNVTSRLAATKMVAAAPNLGLNGFTSQYWDNRSTREYASLYYDKERKHFACKIYAPGGKAESEFHDKSQDKVTEHLKKKGFVRTK